MSGSVTRIAVIGLGRHARRNLVPAVARAEGCALAGVFTRDEGVREEVAEALEVPAFVSLDALWADDRVDAVVIAVPTGVHAEVMRQAIDAGKHVLCEKSFAATPDDWSDVLARAAERGVAALEGFMFVHHPQWQRLVALVEDGELGEICSVTARFGFPHLADGDFRYDPARGGGALLDAGAYPVCAVRSLLGPLERLEAMVESSPDRDVDVAGSALVRDQEGRHGLLEWGFGRSYRNEVEVWGTAGRARLERVFSKPGTLATEVWIQRQANNEVVTIPVPPADHFVAMVEAFGRAVAAGDWSAWAASTADQGAWMASVLRGRG